MDSGVFSIFPLGVIGAISRVGPVAFGEDLILAPAGISGRECKRVPHAREGQRFVLNISP